jgi:hypothetical protein
MSCRYRPLPDHGGDFLPAIDSAQLDLAAGHEAEEEDEGSVCDRQRALGLHAAAKNRGTGNARLLVAYIVKKGEPRRIEASQPACGATLGIP